MTEVCYRNGRKYEKELSDNEVKFIEEMRKRGFTVKLCYHEHYIPTYELTKDNVIAWCKLYTDPRIRVDRQIEDFMKMYNLKVKIKKLHGEV